MAEQVWVLHDDGDWQVMSGQGDALAVADTQHDAIEIGRQLAQTTRSELIWLDIDGEIVGRRSYIDSEHDTHVVSTPRLPAARS